MTGWQLDPDEIIKVLTSTGEARARLAHAIRPKDTQDIIDGVFWPGYAGAVIAPLAQAVADLSELQGKQLDGIATLADVGLSGLTNTTLSYQSGMQDIAAQTQAGMLKGADVLDDGPILGQIPDHTPRRRPGLGYGPGGP